MLWDYPIVHVAPWQHYELFRCVFFLINLGASVCVSLKIRMSEHLTHFLDDTLVKNQTFHHWQTVSYDLATWVFFFVPVARKNVICLGFENNGRPFNKPLVIFKDREPQIKD